MVTVSETAKHTTTLQKTKNSPTSHFGPEIKQSTTSPSTYTFRVKKNPNGKPLFPHLTAARAKPLDAGANGCDASDFYVTPGKTNLFSWDEPDPNAIDFPGTLTENDLANVPGLTVTMNPATVYSSSDISQETVVVPNDFPINQYYTYVVFNSAQGGTAGTLKTVQIAYPLDPPTVDGDATVNVNAGDTAAFNFSQDLVPNGGPITWIVWSTIPDLSTATWTSDQTTAPHTNTLTIQADKYTPPGVYPIGVEVQSSLMCESSPLTTTVYVNVTSHIPPPPTVDEVEQSPLLGQTATYNLQDAATPDSGPLDWTVTINQKEQPPYTLTYKTTSAAPHANALALKTDNNTKPGRYSISVTVTSEITGLTSAPLALTMNAIYGFTYSEKVDSEKYTENGSAAPTGQSAFSLNPPIETQLAQYNDGTSDVADVDAPPGGTGTASVHRSKRIQGSKRHAMSVSGMAIDHNCQVDKAFAEDAINGQITVSPFAVRCDPPAQIGTLHVILEQLDTAGAGYSSVLDTAYECKGASLCLTSLDTVLNITNKSGYYTAQAIVAVTNGQSTAQIGYKLSDTFFYNDDNAIYPYLTGYNQSSPVPFPNPPDDQLSAKCG